MKYRIVSDGLNVRIKLRGWNTKNDRLRETAKKLVGDIGTVRVKYYDDLDLINDIFYDVATGGCSFD